VLDFPPAHALRQTFALRRWTVSQLDAFLTCYDRYMTEGPGRLSFLDNHDMNRFLFMAGGRVDRLKLAALCQFTLTPTPVIYYGTEIGLSQALDKEAHGFGGDAEVRADMPWNEIAWNSDLVDADFHTLVVSFVVEIDECLVSCQHVSSGVVYNTGVILGLCGRSSFTLTRRRN
jgi:glycosidase